MGLFDRFRGCCNSEIGSQKPLAVGNTPLLRAFLLLCIKRLFKAQSPRELQKRSKKAEILVLVGIYFRDTVFDIGIFRREF